MANDLRFTIELDGVQKTITSVSDANKVIRELTKNFVLAKESGKDLTATMSQLNKALEVKQSLLMVSKGAVELKTNMAGAQTASANASMALLNLNYVIRDSPYFFNNFALGVLAVGNNLNPLIDSFNRLRQEAGQKSVSTFQLLRQALVGGAGISIAFSLVVTAIQSYVFWMSKSKDATNEMKSAVESLLEVQNPFDKFKFSLTPEQLKTLRAQLESRTGGFERVQESFNNRAFGGYGGLLSMLGINAPTPKGISDQLKVSRGVTEEVKKQLDFLESQTLVAETLKSLGYNMVNTEKDITKEKEKQLKSAQSRADVEQRMAGAPLTFARRGFYAGEETNKRFGMRQAERTRAFGFGGAVKELDTTLELAKIGAQELGSALEGAFTGAKIKLSDLINQITVAITKMLILQGITSLLTGGLGASASVPSASVGGKEGMWITSGWGDATRFKKQSVNVTVSGRFRANGKEFIADFKNAEKQIDLMRL